MARILLLLAWISVVKITAYKFQINSNIENFRRLNPLSSQADNSQITFPGPTARSSIMNPIIPEIPESCKKSTFCEEVSNYPQELVDRLLAEAHEPLNLQVDRQEETPDITHRFGEPTEEELCKSTSKVVYPQGIQGTDGKWYTLVNRKDNPVQGFKVDICEEDGSSCSDIIIGFQENYTARCKQKHVIRTVSVLDGVPPKIVQMECPIPSCCSCVAQRHIGKII